MAASKFTHFEVGQILALRRTRYKQRDIADSVARATLRLFLLLFRGPRSAMLCKALRGKRFARLAAALFPASLQLQRGGAQGGSYLSKGAQLNPTSPPPSRLQSALWAMLRQVRANPWTVDEHEDAVYST